MVGPYMPLEPDDLRSLGAAQGYLDLGMFLEANFELDEIAPERRHLPEILEVRMHIFCALKKWELMQTIAKKLALSDPENVQWTVLWAYATRRADCIEAARPILISAAEQQEGEALLHFNLACYECQLGNLDGAKERLSRAFAINLRYRALALDDSDLEPLWETLRTDWP